MKETVLAPGLAVAPSLIRARLAAYLPLLKLRITALLVLYGVAAALVAGGGQVPTDRLFFFLLFGSAASSAAAALNHLIERDSDRKMERTRNRPLPSGQVTPRAVALLATALLLVAIPGAWLTLGGAVALQLALGAAVYAGLYTAILKRRTPWNIVVGGIAGSNMALAGWFVGSDHLSLGAWLLAALVFLWTPPHFWGLAVARDSDYRAAGLPMLPQVAGVPRTAREIALYAIATCAVSLALGWYGYLGPVYTAAAIILGLLFVGYALRFWRRPTPRHGGSLFKFSGIYLGLLLLAMLADLWLMHPAVASAHTAPVTLVPVHGVILREAPPELRLTVTQPVEVAFSHLEITGPSGPVQIETPLRLEEGRTLVQVLPALRAGTYTVRWRLLSTDGHVTEGASGFSIDPSAALEPGRPGLAKVTGPSAFSGLQAIGTGALFGILIGVAGWRLFTLVRRPRY